MKKLLLVLVIWSAAVFAQNGIIVKDTLNVVVLQNFNVPGDRFILLTNVFKADFSAELLNSKFEKIRDSKNVTQIPSQKELLRQTGGGRGATVQFALTETIDEPGVYYEKVNIHSQSEVSQKNTTVYYKIVARLPSISSEINLKPSYYFNEKESFSFYGREFTDFDGYSYVIEDAQGNTIEKGNGAFVNLNGILKNIKNVGKSLKITGMYHGRKFNYLDPATGNTRESAWQFSIKKLNLEEFSDFQKSDTYKEVFISAYDKNAMKILYTYMGNTESGFVVVTPEVSNFQVKSEPVGFIKSYAAKKSGNFLYVTFELNDEFLSTMEKCSEENLKLTVRFSTQFGENIERTYDATILK
ncbi:MAG: hypothetical protein HF314_07355 [Ignavibacteria bacterium]|jgi:hypothetical protein|nr:hypothetical protein [Ignavibacteria bacterium]MCU7502872.1 hypothetical protein [Ignavibacteria bacterium]MCU7515634.1 hypothetical protein [Ignavibacteria bacterium]